MKAWDSRTPAMRRYVQTKTDANLTAFRSELFQIFGAMGSEGPEGELKTAAARLINFVGVELDARAMGWTEDRV